LLEHPVDPREQPEDSGRVVRSRLVLVGEEVRLAVQLGSRSGSALAEGPEDFLDARAKVEKAGSEWAHEELVAGGGEEVDVVGDDIDGNVADGLGGVDDEGNGVFAGDAADFAHRLNSSGDVGGVGDGDELGVAADGPLNVVGIDQAGGGIHPHAGEGDRAAVGEGVKGTEDGVVVEVCADGVRSAAGGGDVGFEDALDGEVEGVGAVEGEDDVVGRGGVDELADGGAAIGEHAGGFDGFSVSSAAGRCAELGEVARDGGEDAGRLGEGGGGVVEVKSSRRVEGCFGGRHVGKV